MEELFMVCDIIHSFYSLSRMLMKRVLKLMMKKRSFIYGHLTEAKTWLLKHLGIYSSWMANSKQVADINKEDTYFNNVFISNIGETFADFETLHKIRERTKIAMQEDPKVMMSCKRIVFFM